MLNRQGEEENIRSRRAYDVRKRQSAVKRIKITGSIEKQESILKTDRIRKRKGKAT